MRKYNLQKQLLVLAVVINGGKYIFYMTRTIMHGIAFVSVL